LSTPGRDAQNAYASVFILENRGQSLSGLLGKLATLSRR
jgi:hypothetical protein